MHLSNKTNAGRADDLRGVTSKEDSATREKSKSFEQVQKTKESPWCLIVDDNPFNLMVANNIVQERGYQVKTGLNGKEAIAKVKEHHESGETFKMILMDCQMPIMDGYEATRRLKELMKQGQIPECPIVALTANIQDEEHDKICADVGMSGCLAKPLKIKELELVLREASNS